EIAIVENVQRADLNPMEEANALHRLREEFELTHQQTAEAVGKSRATITNLLRLRNLNDDVKKLLENCDLEMGHARTLLALEGESQSEAALQIVEKGLSVRETEQLIRRLLKSSPADKQEVPQPSLEEIERLEQRLAEKLGKGFSIKHRANGKGKLVFDYSNVDELKHLIKQIGV
ncbi:MAG TPA: chromosome partitioning protein ParB, partial [Methylophaga sp.]|nr:chromosome partitioning protein ParB [Methylophaga sp.]